MTEHPDIDTSPSRRLSMSELVRLLVSRQQAATPAVELTRNAKGDTQIAVKSTADDLFEAERLAVEVYDRLREQYPLSEPPTPPSPKAADTRRAAVEGQK